MENNPTPPAAAAPETPAIGGALPENVLRVEGILDLDSNKAGTLIDITRNGKRRPADPFVPRELIRPPRAWVEKLYNVSRWTPMPAGGHFAAMEEPARLVDDVRAFFRALR